MLSIRRGLALLALTAAAVVVPALPASAHTGDFTRDCENVTLKLTKFKASPEDDKNVVQVFRNDEAKPARTITFTESNPAVEVFPEDPGVAVSYRAVWNDTGADNHSGKAERMFGPLTGCDTEPEPECVDEGGFTYEFNGAEGMATVTLETDNGLPLCEPAAALLASYDTEGATAETAGQRLVIDQVGADILEPGDYELQVELSDCFTEVSLYFFGPDVAPMAAADFEGTDPLAEFLASAQIGEKGAPPTTFNAGKACPSPTVAPTSPAAAPPQGSGGLADTGVGNTLPLIGLGVLLLGGGAAMTMFTRRRRTTG